MARNLKILVIGAGPVGSIMALALCQRGLNVTLIEALGEPEIECRAASCHPPTVAVLDAMGLLEAGLEQGLVSPVFNYLDRPSGELIARFDIGAMRTPPIAGPQAVLSTTTIAARPIACSCNKRILAGPSSSPML